MNTKEIGALGEKIAKKYLEDKGYLLNKLTCEVQIYSLKSRYIRKNS